MICGLILMFAGILAILFLRIPSGRLICEIKQGNTVLHTIRLSEGYQDTIVIVQNGIENVITIDSMQVYFSHSTCPDQVCVRTGKLTHAGQMAVCLPTRVTVRLIGEETEVDAIAG